MWERSSGVAIDPNSYPKFDSALKASMRGETIHFFGELFRKNLSALNILDSNFTMLDEPLAKHYGLTGPKGSHFERVSIKPGHHRGGILAHGSVLLGNSSGEDSHPVKRAVWIRERLLDDPPAPPPPDVPALDSTDPDFSSLSVHDQLELSIASRSPVMSVIAISIPGESLSKTLVLTDSGERRSSAKRSKEKA